MAKRAGKAASRKARQRRVQRPATSATNAATPMEGPAPSPSPTPAATVARTPGRLAAPASGAGSQLTASERSEYHYVERDLRDIAILTAIMAALLFVAWLVFSAIGIGG